jgi:hypothetical protein
VIGFSQEERTSVLDKHEVTTMTNCLERAHRAFSAEQNAAATLWLAFLFAVCAVIEYVVPGNGAADEAQGFALVAIVCLAGLASAFYDATFKQTYFAMLHGAPVTWIIFWGLVFGFYCFKFHEAMHAIGPY